MAGVYRGEQQLSARVDEQRDGRKVVRIDAGIVQAPPRGLLWELFGVFDAGEAFLFGGGQHSPVGHQRGCRVVGTEVEAEDRVASHPVRAGFDVINSCPPR